jgi:UDP-N-acetylmuramoyl-tripeptide--D-alanyl-D-alanine ligase
MIPMTLAEIAAVVGGEVEGDPTLTVLGPAFVDTRAPVEGGLFVAVAGERVDGHDFAGSAIEGGAVAVLGSRRTDVPTIVVADPVVALGRLARHVVDETRPTVLALTGSQGKTGTKDYLAHVLEGFGQTVATVGNLNNEIGVPLTALRSTAHTTYLVV